MFNQDFKFVIFEIKVSFFLQKMERYNTHRIRYMYNRYLVDIY